MSNPYKHSQSYKDPSLDAKHSWASPSGSVGKESVGALVRRVGFFWGGGSPVQTTAEIESVKPYFSKIYFSQIYFLVAVNSHACLSVASLADMHLMGHASHRDTHLISVHFTGRSPWRLALEAQVWHAERTSFRFRLHDRFVTAVAPHFGCRRPPAL